MLQDGAGGGALALTKSGADTLTLSGANTYTGTTTVSAGTLLVNGSQSGSAVNVSSNATLGGAGGTVGAVTVSNGGTVWPGGGASGSYGTLTAASADFSAAETPGATLKLSFSSDLTGHDELVLTGVLTAGGSSVLKIDTVPDASHTGPVTAAAYNNLSVPQFASIDNPSTTIGVSLTPATTTTALQLTFGAASPSINWAAGSQDSNGALTLANPATWNLSGLLWSATIDTNSKGLVLVLQNNGNVSAAVTVSYTSASNWTIGNPQGQDVFMLEASPDNSTWTSLDSAPAFLENHERSAPADQRDAGFLSALHDAIIHNAACHERHRGDSHRQRAAVSRRRAKGGEKGGARPG